MKLRLEAEPGELESKALSAVRHVASQLAKYDSRLLIVAKALWKADLAVKQVVDYQGLKVSIENPIGSVRTWKDDETQSAGSTVMKHPYGYIQGTTGADGDSYDCFLGPDPDAPFVWVVHQARPDKGETQYDASAIYDEDKAMLGFNDAHEAAAAFHSHYDDPSFFGSMTQLPIDEFKLKVFGTNASAQDGMVKAKPAPASKSAPAATAAKKERFIIPRDRDALSKSGTGLAPYLTVPDGMADRGISTGAGGLSVALEDPVRPINLTNTGDQSPTSLHGAIEAFTSTIDEDRKTAVRRDPKVYETSTLTNLPVHPLPEWEQRMIVGEQARADAPTALHYVQDKLDRRSWAVRENSPQRLLPRETRSQRFFIPADKAEVRRQEHAVKADSGAATTESGAGKPNEAPARETSGPLPNDKPYPRVAAPEPAEPKYNIDRELTVQKSIGAVVLRVVAEAEGQKFEVIMKGRVPRTFSTLTAACDHVWVIEKGFRDVKHWRAQTGRRKVPSGAGWRFWGVDPAAMAEEVRT